MPSLRRAIQAHTRAEEQRRKRPLHLPLSHTHSLQRMSAAAPSLEQAIKAQFARLFTQSDWALFKQMGEFYLRSAVALKIADIDAPSGWELLARNSQKRLHIGVGVELLVKSFYLRRGYQVNKLVDERAANAPRRPYTFDEVANVALQVGDSFTLGPLLDTLHRVGGQLPSVELIRRGFRIAMVFRNKEGHAIYPRHNFDPNNYRDIEIALMALYDEAFNEELRVRFSMETDEEALWKISAKGP
jgi:hypothetical protein